MPTKVINLLKCRKVYYLILILILLPVFYYIFDFCYNFGNYIGIFLRNLYKIIPKC